jgi:hypothetical protein
MYLNLIVYYFFLIKVNEMLHQLLIEYLNVKLTIVLHKANHLLFE